MVIAPVFLNRMKIQSAPAKRCVRKGIAAAHFTSPNNSDMKDNNTNLPQDPMMLLSFINMKLRDEFSSLDELCASLGVSRKYIEESLSKAGFEYNQEENKFW